MGHFLQTKLVEDVVVTILDAGSTPAISTSAVAPSLKLLLDLVKRGLKTGAGTGEQRPQNYLEMRS